MITRRQVLSAAMATGVAIPALVANSLTPQQRQLIYRENALALLRAKGRT